MSAGASAAAAAAIRGARERKEEEEMTPYKGNDLDGWEFKIVRTNFGAFKNRKFLEKVCREEQQNGWEMLEKFDNNRIRFKRRTENRSRDAGATIDPFRNAVGIGSGEATAIIIASIILGFGIAIVLITRFQADGTEMGSIPVVAIGVGILALLMVVLLRMARRR